MSLSTKKKISIMFKKLFVVHGQNALNFLIKNVSFFLFLSTGYLTVSSVNSDVWHYPEEKPNGVLEGKGSIFIVIL